ncbi:MAG: hypothetical protein JXB50_15130 [Spirochaetes bacterium]|nr:hypothetical protein [Spirochaetota bacterium]
MYENFNKKIDQIFPDIIIEYNYDFENINPVSVIYVRPETNKISYEKAILKGILPYSDVIFMANLNGQLFIKNALILDHYASQYRFAIYGPEEIKKYPLMSKKIEDYFNIDINSPKLIGSFEAILKLNITPEELFNTFVDDKDFYKICGQTIKKLYDMYIINYDLPAIFLRYDDNSNIFIIVIKFKNNKIKFQDINYSIANEIKNDKYLKFYDEEKYKDMDLIEKAKRTYHFSSSHTMAMYDMSDFVYNTNGERIQLKETPLGYYLLNNNIASEDILIKLKEFPIINTKKNNQETPINIIEDIKNYNFEQCIELIKNINLNKNF